MPNIAICGAHRTGKTTLARAAAEVIGASFVPTSFSSVFRERGVNVQAGMSVDERLEIQEALLARARVIYRQALAPFITDRSPIDLLAYTLAEVGKSLTAAQEARVSAYADACFDLAGEHFTTLVLVQPGIPLVADATKAVASPTYLAHLTALMRGLLADERLAARVGVIGAETIDLSARVDVLREIVWTGLLPPGRVPCEA